eukprot:733783-Pelagomonas_calceolata.AAC.2
MVLSDEVKMLVKEVEVRMVEQISTQSREDKEDIPKIVDALFTLFTREQARIDRELAKAPRGYEVHHVTCSSREWCEAYLDALWVVRSTLEHECAGGEAPSTESAVKAL